MNEPLISAINFAVCIVAWYSCVCRLLEMRGERVKNMVRYQYITWFVLLPASGFSWCYGEPATLVQLLLSIGGAGYIFMGYGAWRQGVPSYALKQENS